MVKFKNRSTCRWHYVPPPGGCIECSPTLYYIECIWIFDSIECIPFHESIEYRALNGVY